MANLCSMCGTDRKVIRMTDCSNGTTTEICADCHVDGNAAVQSYPISIDGAALAHIADALLIDCDCEIGRAALADFASWGRAFSDGGNYDSTGAALAWGRKISADSVQSARADRPNYHIGGRRIWGRASGTADILRAEILMHAAAIAQSADCAIVQFSADLVALANEITSTPCTGRTDRPRAIGV